MSEDFLTEYGKYQNQRIKTINSILKHSRFYRLKTFGLYVGLAFGFVTIVIGLMFITKGLS